MGENKRQFFKAHCEDKTPNEKIKFYMEYLAEVRTFLEQDFPRNTQDYYRQMYEAAEKELFLVRENLEKLVER